MSEAQRILEFPPGELVIQERTPATALFVVKEGQLEAFKVDAHGRIIPVAIINSGEFLGESAVLLNKPHSTNVRALTHVKLIKITREALEAQLKLAPAWFVALTKGLAERLQATNELLRKNKIVDHSLMSASQAAKDKLKKSG